MAKRSMLTCPQTDTLREDEHFILCMIMSPVPEESFI
jgi:hypothetical protein